MEGEVLLEAVLLHDEEATGVAVVRVQAHGEALGVSELVCVRVVLQQLLQLLQLKATCEWPGSSMVAPFFVLTMSALKTALRVSSVG